MKTILGLTIALAFAFACSDTTDSTTHGVADFSVTVLTLNGQPAANAIVSIRCADGAIATTVTTDNTGHATGSLDAPVAVMKDGATAVCVFGVPTVDNVKFRTEYSVGFREPGTPGPVHFVTVQEVQ